MTAKAALVTGVGPGTGLATVRRFVEGGFRVAMIARDAERLNAIATEVPGTLACPADVTDTAAFMAAIDRAEAWAGAPEVVVHNAVGGASTSRTTASTGTSRPGAARSWSPAIPRPCAGGRISRASPRPRQPRGYWPRQSPATWDPKACMSPIW